MKADTVAMIRKARDDLRQLSLQRGAAEEVSASAAAAAVASTPHAESITVRRVKATDTSSLHKAAPPPSPSKGVGGVLHTASQVNRSFPRLRSLGFLQLELRAGGRAVYTLQRHSLRSYLHQRGWSRWSTSARLREKAV